MTTYSLRNKPRHLQPLLGDGDGLHMIERHFLLCVMSDVEPYELAAKSGYCIDSLAIVRLAVGIGVSDCLATYQVAYA